MSLNTVDALIRMAYRHQRTLMIVASRGQVECADQGGGYVERWSTEVFTDYVRRRDPANLMMICRDHGGPWQHPAETAANLDEPRAMASSLASLLVDIEAGMDLLHLDTSREGEREADFDSAMRRLLALYGECQEFAQKSGRRVAFEVGLERQGRDADDPRGFRRKLECIVDGLAEDALPLPTFVVAQTGTRVVASENRGALVDEPAAVGVAVSKLAEACWEHGLALKVHNADYLPKPALRALLANGADAINIAPEFGVIETREFLALLDRLGLAKQREDFLRLAHESGAWRKWFEDDGTDLERSVVAGHYVFATDEFREIKQQADNLCRKQGHTVDSVLGAALDRALERYAAIAWGTDRTQPWNL
jgi:tagatose-1,6-bisphosphate aldolase non-catalytic subunit AgaZ/GatZ